VAESLETIAFGGPPVGFFKEDLTADLAGNAFETVSLGEQQTFLRGRYFDFRVARVAPGSTWHPEGHGPAATVAMCLRGSGELNGRTLQAGQTLLLPAALPADGTTFRAAVGKELTLLLSSPTPDA
jgi:hypothetical protein